MAPEPQSQMPRPARAMRILLLDDDVAFADELRSHLAQVAWGRLSVEPVASIADALARLEHSGFDLIVAGLDVSGAAGLDELERLVHGSTCPVIVATDKRRAAGGSRARRSRGRLRRRPARAAASVARSSGCCAWRRSRPAPSMRCAAARRAFAASSTSRPTTTGSKTSSIASRASKGASSACW
jgi:CheY-like chemotaxis protein